jgi:mono/diheme cytochrome c family protein
MGNLFQALRRRRVIRLAIINAMLLVQATAWLSTHVSAQTLTSTAIEYRALLDQYCVTCHNRLVVDAPDAPPNALLSQLRAVGLKLDALDLSAVATNAAHWEPVVRKLRAGLMPPAGLPRPDPATLDGFRVWLETALDGAAAARPNPGRTASFHRLNRAEYGNAIRDLLALEIDIDDFLPADDAGYGFDNIGGVLRMSQSLLERYLDASRTISRLAVGSPPSVPFSETFRTAQDGQQHERAVGLPFGTRGGMLLSYLFPLDADYDLSIQLSGTRGLRDEHRLEVTVDGEPIEQFTIGSASTIALRLRVAAGPRDIGVAFYRNPPVLVEQVRERFQNPRTAGNSGGPGGAMPFVSSVTIAGPYNASGPGQTPSRDRIFSCQPATVDEEPACARRILSDLARRAYRRPVSDDDIEVLLEFYAMGRAGASDPESAFERGIELALRRLLVSPEFLVRIEVDPAGIAPDTPYVMTDLEVASRLSFFLWSSIPDEELLALAERGALSNPAELERQVRRLLADPRSKALTINFAGQWLQLRNLATVVRPGEPYAVAFDETLRQAMITETELFFDSVVRQDRGVLELLTADYTYLNARLAGHYDIPNVQGAHFRRVGLAADSPRGGLLGQGSILTLTSHAIRTSPVLRGKWILDNILGTPPPDPPPNVPALEDSKTSARVATMRERMSAHRDNPVCAACHSMIDPAGFALEGFDAIGRFREVDEWFNPIDTSGALPDGTAFDGAAQLRVALVQKPQRFVGTVTEKLLTYALGRGLDYYDMPAVRRIVRESADADYGMQAIIVGIVNSYPFLHRRSGS